LIINEQDYFDSDEDNEALKSSDSFTSFKIKSLLKQKRTGEDGKRDGED